MYYITYKIDLKVDKNKFFFPELCEIDARTTNGYDATKR